MNIRNKLRLQSKVCSRAVDECFNFKEGFSHHLQQDDNNQPNCCVWGFASVKCVILDMGTEGIQTLTDLFELKVCSATPCSNAQETDKLTFHRDCIKVSLPDSYYYIGALVLLTLCSWQWWQSTSLRLVMVACYLGMVDSGGMLHLHATKEEDQWSNNRNISHLCMS